MFNAYASKTPTTLSVHHATIKERAHAARYIDRSEAEGVIFANTDITRANPPVYEHAVAVAIEAARDISSGRDPFDLIWDGLTVEEQIAQHAVDAVNEVIFEAMVS